MKNKLSIRTSLTQLVLPIVGVQNVVKLEQIKHLESVIKEQSIFTFDQWMNKASCETDVAEHLLRLVYNISADYMNRYGKLPTWLLVFVLFLQNISVKRRRLLGEKKKNVEEVLVQFVLENFETVKEIFEFSPPERLERVLELVFHNSNLINQDFSNVKEAHLSPDAHGMVSCVKHGKRLAWSLPNPQTSHSAKMATTGHLTNKSGIKKIILCQLVKQTIIKNTETVTGSSLLIHRCLHSQFYFPTHLRCLEINKCRQSSIVTGPIKKVLRVTGCRNLTIVCIAKRVIIQDCVDCQFYLVSPNPPLLSHSCRDITFAPYNVYYQGLIEDLTSSCLDQNFQNLWNKPEIVASNQVTCDPDVCKLLDSNLFRNLIFPVNVDIDSNYFSLPSKYQDTGSNLECEFEQILKDSNLTQSQRNLVENSMNEAFNEFIMNNYETLSTNIHRMID